MKLKVFIGIWIGGIITAIGVVLLIQNLVHGDYKIDHPVNPYTFHIITSHDSAYLYDSKGELIAKDKIDSLPAMIQDGNNPN